MAFLLKKPLEQAPDRLVLAEAIRERDEHRAHTNARNTALARAQATLDDTRRARASAESAMEDSIGAMKDFMIASAKGENVEKPLSIKDARADREVAQVEYSAANDAFAAIKAEVDKFGQSNYYEDKVRDLAAAIIHQTPATAFLIAEAFELRRRLNEKWHILNAVARLSPSGIGADEELARAVHRLNRHPAANDAADAYEDVVQSGKVGPWTKAFESLLVDAGAQIEI